MHRKARLDKTCEAMVKYIRTEYRVERKEYRKGILQRAGVIGWKPGQGRLQESASGSEYISSDK